MSTVYGYYAGQTVTMKADFLNSSGSVLNTLTTTITLPSVTTNYTISYNANGATSGSVPGSQTVAKGSTVTLRQNSGNLAKTGYVLDGWATSASGAKAYDLGGQITNVTSNITLYAH